MTKEKKNTIRGAGRVGFLARRDDIKKMIEAGHPLLSIYQQYEKDMSIGYSQFVKYVHKFIRSKPSEAKSPEERKLKKPESGDDRPGFKSSTRKLDDLV